MLPSPPSPVSSSSIGRGSHSSAVGSSTHESSDGGGGGIGHPSAVGFSIQGSGESCVESRGIRFHSFFIGSYSKNVFATQ